MTDHPSNLEAEQALLGCVLYDNAAFVAVDGLVAQGDFFEPLHGRMFKVLGDLIRSGRLAEPITCHDYFSIEPAYRQLGGIKYLADLVDRAPPAAGAPEYARLIRSAALRREAMRISRGIFERAKSDPTVSGDDLMAEMEREFLGVRQGGVDNSMHSFGSVAAEVVDGMDRPPADRHLINFGLEKLDTVMGGAERGDLIVLGARPSMGKSALAGCIAVNVAKAGLGVAEVNWEMSREQMTRRHLTDLAYTRWGKDAPTYRDIRRGNLTPDQKAMLHDIRAQYHQLPLVMEKRAGLTLPRLRSMLVRQKMLWQAMGIPMALVILDHVGLIPPDDEMHMKRVEAQTALSGGLKRLAEDLEVTVLALAQLNRKVEDRDDKRPQLADLRDSGSWEQDADMVIGVYRDAYYARREREPKSDLKLAEWMQRCNDPTVEALFLKLREGDVAVAKLFADIARNAIRDNEPDLAFF